MACANRADIQDEFVVRNVFPNYLNNAVIGNTPIGLMIITCYIKFYDNLV